MTRVLALFAALALTFSAAAQNLGPDQLVQKITDEILAAIKSDKQLAAGDKQKALKLAEEKVLPHIDFEEATRLGVGRAWRTSDSGMTSVAASATACSTTFRSWRTLPGQGAETSTSIASGENCSRPRR